MVDGTSSRVLQDLLDGCKAASTLFGNENESSIIGEADGKFYWFIFDSGPVEQRPSPDSSISYIVRPALRIFYNKRTVRGAAHVGYDAHRNTIIVWDARGSVIREYPDVSWMQSQP